ncbi:MAG TPA: phosphatidate cytidylyltransferase [Terriglobia bacterium]|jgi:phosphatidate cytidylyltransferase
MRRILTGIVLIGLVVALVLYGTPRLFVAAQLAVALPALWEFFRLAGAAGFQTLRVPGYLVATALSSLPLVMESPEVGIVVVSIFSLMLTMILAMRPGREVSDVIGSVAVSFLGPMYVVVPLVLLVCVWLNYDGPRRVLFALVVIWAGDTAAYFIGRAFGRHKCSPRISPNKTWEGVAASLAASLLVALVAAHWFARSGAWWELLPLAVALNIAGQFGDLAESALKRSAGAKDSSQLVPGHGGVLDRIDALLFAAPVLWYYWLWQAPFAGPS